MNEETGLMRTCSRSDATSAAKANAAPRPRAVYPDIMAVRQAHALTRSLVELGHKDWFVGFISDGETYWASGLWCADARWIELSDEAQSGGIKSDKSLDILIKSPSCPLFPTDTSHDPAIISGETVNIPNEALHLLDYLELVCKNGKRVLLRFNNGIILNITNAKFDASGFRYSGNNYLAINVNGATRNRPVLYFSVL